MYNGNTYKRFCAIMISLGVILSVGQFSYAHSFDLLEAESTINENPTKENLVRLYNLYNQDITFHSEMEEMNEAKKSKAFAAWTKARIALAHSKERPTPENWETEARCWEKAAKLTQSIGYNENAAVAQKNAAFAKARAAWAKAEKVSAEVRTNPISINSEYLQIYWDVAARFCEAAGYDKDAAKAKVYAAEAKAIHAGRITIYRPTPSNFECEAVYWENAAKLCEAIEELDYKVEYYRAEAVLARANQANVIAVLTQTIDNWEKAASLWDKVAMLFKKLGDDDQNAKAKASAAWARAKKAGIIAINDLTLKNLEDVTRLWEEAAKLSKEIRYNDDDINIATSYADNAKIQQAYRIAVLTPTIEHWDNVINLSHEVITVELEKLSSLKVHSFDNLFIAKTYNSLAQANKAQMLLDFDRADEHDEAAVASFEHIKSNLNLEMIKNNLKPAPANQGAEE